MRRIKSLETSKPREATETKESGSMRKTALALIGVLTGATALISERFEPTEHHEEAKQQQELSHEEIQNLRKQVDTASKLVDALARVQEITNQEEKEYASDDFRRWAPSREALQALPGAYLDKETADAMFLPGFSSVERGMAKQFADDPELKARFLQSVESVRIDGESDSLHAYLPEDPDFDIVFDEDEDEGIDRIMMSNANGRTISSLGPAAENYSEEELKTAIRRDIQYALFQHLKDKSE